VKVGRDRSQSSQSLPPWWVEVAVLVSMYYLYTATRGVADGSEVDAVAVGWDLQRFSEAVHIDVELGLNRWLQNVPVLAVISCYYYATLHFIVTPAVLIWTYRRHPGSYVQARWTIAFTTLICLAGFFLVPTAPPRLLPGSGYIDTMSHFAGWGWWSATSSAAPDGLDSLANQYAALPSLHCAWALWCGFLLVRNARTPVVRILGALYPAATVFVVTATANHYLVDAFAGWAVLGVAALLSLALVRRRARRAVAPTPTPTPTTATRPEPVTATMPELTTAASPAALPTPALAPTPTGPTTPVPPAASAAADLSVTRSRPARTATATSAGQRFATSTTTPPGQP
jgi:hypothetical protein